MSVELIRHRLSTTVETDWLDLRLGVGAVAGWLVVAVCIAMPSDVVAMLGGGAVVVGAALLVGGHRRARSVFTSAAMLAFIVSVVSMPLAATLRNLERSPLRTLADARATTEAEISLDKEPRPLANHGGTGPPRVIIEASLTTIEVGGTVIRYDDPVLVLGVKEQWRNLLAGQRVRVRVQVRRALDDPLVAAALESSSPPQLIGSPPWWEREAAAIRADLRSATEHLPTKVAGLLPGLIDGDTSRMDPVLGQQFRDAGLSHLVAVSGANCAIVVGAAFLGLRRLSAGPVLTSVLAAVVLVGFVVVARPSPSVLRASVMAGIALVAYATGRTKAILPALSLTVIALLVWDPGLARDAGFAMSVLASAAIVTIAPRWALRMQRRGCPGPIAEAVAVATVAHLVTAPVVVAISGQVSLVAILANVLADPVVPLITLLGFVSAATAPFCLPVARLAAEAAGWPCRWLIWVAEHGSSVEGGAISWPAGLSGAVLLIVVSGLLWRMLRGGIVLRLLAVVVVGVLLLQIPIRAIVQSWPPHGLIFLACDVGQGDGLILPVNATSAVVVDAGPDPVPIARCLDELGVTDVPLVVLTHLHMDHVAGLTGVFHDRQVHRVITGPLAAPETGQRLVTDVLARHGMRLGTIAMGEAFDFSSLHLDVLGPREAFRGTRSDPNNSSVILRATIGSARLLLLGDAELEAQQQLLDDHVDLRADVVKVAHHGSAYSLPAVLEQTGARLGIISVGANNDFGHPAPLTLGVLSRLGIEVKRTDRDGDIALVSEGGTLHCVTRRSAILVP